MELTGKRAQECHMKALAASLAALSEETKTIEETLALLRRGK